jgi:3-phenylpropionate/trans-cinnamate dioxygenase ferredoxin subunit
VNFTKNVIRIKQNIFIDRTSKIFNKIIAKNFPASVMSETKYQWFKIAENVDEFSFGENNLAVVEANCKKLTLAKFNNELFACTYLCPHASGVLADGYIDTTGNIACPVHRYKFNLMNGRNTTGEGYYLKTYPVKINEEGIFVGFEEKGFFTFF